MSDQQPKPVTFNAGRETGGDPSKQEAQKVTSPEYVTREQAQALAEQAAEEAYRRAQGLVDKTGSRFEKKIKAGLSNLEKAINWNKAAGIEVTPEQETKMRNQVIFEATQDTGEDPPPDSQPDGSGQPTNQEEVDPVTKQAFSIMDAAGVRINDNDPEADTINTEGTPEEYLTSIRSAIRAKIIREAQQGAPGNGQSATRTPSGIGGGGGVPPQNYSEMTLDEIWEAAEKQGKI